MSSKENQTKQPEDYSLYVEDGSGWFDAGGRDRSRKEPNGNF